MPQQNESILAQQVSNLQEYVKLQTGVLQEFLLQEANKRASSRVRFQIQRDTNYTYVPVWGNLVPSATQGLICYSKPIDLSLYNKVLVLTDCYNTYTGLLSTRIMMLMESALGWHIVKIAALAESSSDDGETTPLGSPGALIQVGFVGAQFNGPFTNCRFAAIGQAQIGGWQLVEHNNMEIIASK